MSTGKSVPPASVGPLKTRKRLKPARETTTPREPAESAGVSTVAIVVRVTLVLFVVGAGITAAWQFKKEAAAPDAPSNETAGLRFGQPVERRVTTTLKPSGPGAGNIYQPAPSSDPAYKAPIAATPSQDRTSAPPDLPPSYQRTFSPFGTLLNAPDEAEASEPAVETARREEVNPLRVSKGDTGTTMHKIADGDTLSKLAVRYLGSAERYLEIYTLNRDVLASPDLLPIGTVIKIPRSQPATGVGDEPALVPIPKGALRN